MAIARGGGLLLARSGRRPPGRRSTVVLLTVDLAALAAVVMFSRDWRPLERRDAIVLALLVVGALLHVETARILERRRGVAVARRPHVDLESVWTFAAVLLVPLGPALLLVILTSVHAWLRTWRRPSPPLWLATTSARLLATCAAGLELRSMPVGTLLHGVADPAGIGAAVVVTLTRWAVAFLLVACAVAAVGPGEAGSAVLGSRMDLLLSSGTVVLGLALAVVLVRSPWSAPVLLLPLFVMHREAQLQELSQLAGTDGKTGLCTVAAWRAVAHRLLARARRRRSGPKGLGVLMIDLDGFKGVNDRHGHLTGDAVLRAVAGILRSEVRPIDRAGRFGGEEFVVLLADLHVEDAVATAGRTAERIRARVARMTVEIDVSDRGPGLEAAAGAPAAPVPPAVLTDLSVSVGVATYPDDADSVDALVLAADTALYAAKRSGRNRVVHASEPPAGS